MARSAHLLSRLFKMSQPRKGSQLRNISERFSMRRYHTTERFQEPHRSQSRKLAKEKKMSGALPGQNAIVINGSESKLICLVDPMDIDSGSTVRHSIRDGHHEGTFLEDEKLEEQYELVNRKSRYQNASMGLSLYIWTNSRRPVYLYPSK